ncbi:hypothetical protein NEOLEDRAFT_1141129 [Neolentinus lepideus HHB14362 ss-1]|uniref:Uncharacterized protein n=1 Tax=Neolentinus lepideus HHB14362 ss-1 TaxID=1314782 RepID=A0A165NVB3_9AGAM|nr:hypothetical protein NEOLEDRAFT_1141129 [Neolentinus lepideus HHB14362 ss-1]
MHEWLPKRPAKLKLLIALPVSITLHHGPGGQPFQPESLLVTSLSILPHQPGVARCLGSKTGPQ